jgi:hypothetical protein
MWPELLSVVVLWDPVDQNTQVLAAFTDHADALTFAERQPTRFVRRRDRERIDWWQPWQIARPEDRSLYDGGAFCIVEVRECRVIVLRSVPWNPPLNALSVVPNPDVEDAICLKTT